MAMAIPQSRQGSTHKYLRIQDLRRLRYLHFASRRMIEGQLAGRHDSRQRGHSIEFNDYRQYMPGDEIGDVDWKVYGRSDKLFIKLYEHETEMTVNMVVDASASMAYRGIGEISAGQKVKKEKPLAKFDQACFLAAAISFLTLKRRDRVSLGLARKGLIDFQRPSGSMTHLRAVLDAMEFAKPAGQADIALAIRTISRMVGRRGLLILLSDLLDDRDAIMKALAQYMARGSEVIIFHILHGDELRLPEALNGLFIDSESDERVRLEIDDVRAAYQEKMKQFLYGWSQACKSRGVDYNLVSTSDNYHEVLRKYLLRRSVRRT